MKTKPKVIRFISFILVSIIIFYSLQFMFFDQSNRRTFSQQYQWEQFYLLEKDSIDVLFIGNSHANSLDQNVISDLLDTKTVAVGTGGATILQTEIELKEVCEHQSPQVIVLEPYILQQETVETNFITTYYNINDNKLPFYVLFVHPHMWFRAKSALVTDHDIWKKPDVLFSNLRKSMNLIVETIRAEKVGESTEIAPVARARNSEFVIDFVDYNTAVSSVTKYSEPPKEYFNSLMDIIRNRKCGQNLVVVRTPLIREPDYLDIYPISPFEEILSANNIPYYDLNEVANFKDPSSLLYFDSHHVSSFGKVIESVETATYLANELDLKINPQKVDYYKTYYFKDYVISQNGDDVSVTLQPLDENVSKNLQYRWAVGDEFNTITLETEYQEGMNGFTFQLSDGQENYYIDVWIHNPDGNFVLHAVISYKNIK